MDGSAAYVAKWDLEGVTGTVVAVDVLRAFTTAAYALGNGAREIWLVAEVEDAVRLGAQLPGSLLMGEEHGLRPDGFDFSNSPVEISHADLEGRTLVQRTSAGTRGVVAATSADRLFASSLVCASATAAAIDDARLGAPTYVITGRFPDRLDGGTDDLVTAEFIEKLRIGGAPDREAVRDAVLGSEEAARTLALGHGHVHPDDLTYATDIDRFDFAMEVERRPQGLALRRKATLAY